MPGEKDKSPQGLAAGHGLKENTQAMEQFVQITQKVEGTFHSLHFTRNMLHGIIDLELKSAAALTALVENKKKANLPFSQLDKGIQSYWLKQKKFWNQVPHIWKKKKGGMGTLTNGGGGWTKKKRLETARLRIEMAQQLQTEVIEPIDGYLSSSKEKIKNLMKGNVKTQKSFQTLTHELQKNE
ncbi:hypothetical protein RFI_18805, partial [Reticulomyxa filosa]